LSGIEGQFTAQAHGGDIALQINRLHASGHTPVRDSGSYTQDSSAAAPKGNIFARIAPSV